MATINAGGPQARRSVNSELPLVPFIDFLLCLVAFLLVTAVWSQMARLEATANVPGQVSTRTDPVKQLHVRVKDSSFELVWKRGDTVLVTSQVVRRAEKRKDGSVSYPELAQRLDAEWQSQGEHKGAMDQKRDIAVLHSPNSMEFGDLAGIIDAIHAPSRSFGSQQERVAAFSLAFAAD
jgi:biopolymer transport protein ExbD